MVLRSIRLPEDSSLIVQNAAACTDDTRLGVRTGTAPWEVPHGLLATELEETAVVVVGSQISRNRSGKTDRHRGILPMPSRGVLDLRRRPEQHSRT